jgi:hypothetical protein
VGFIFTGFALMAQPIFGNAVEVNLLAASSPPEPSWEKKKARTKNLSPPPRPVSHLRILQLLGIGFFILEFSRFRALTLETRFLVPLEL